MLPFSIISNTNILPKVQIQKVKHSYSTTVSNYILRTNGELYAGGDNSYGQLGNGTLTNLPRSMIRTRDDVRLFDHYNTFTAVVTLDNKIMFCGSNLVYNAKSGSVFTWQDISTTRFSGVNIQDVIKISCAYSSIYVLLSNGNLYSTGSNTYGQLGNGTITDNYTQTPILVSTGIKDVFNSDYGLYIIKNDGTVWGCGNNGYGRYCCIDTTAGASAANSTGYAVRSLNQMFSTVSTKPDVVYIFGATNNLALTQDGVSTGCGNISYGSIGLGYNTTPGNTNGVLSTASTSISPIPVQPKLGINYSCTAMNRTYIGVDNNLYTIGYNYHGELGLGSTNPTSAPVISWTKVPLSIDAKNIIGIDHGYFQTYIYTTDRVYFTGGIDNCMSTQFGASGNILNYTELSLSF